MHEALIININLNRPLQFRLYDISAQRRPVMSIDFRETSITAISEDVDGNTVYIGNGSGDLASYDIRTGTCSDHFNSTFLVLVILFLC